MKADEENSSGGNIVLITDGRNSPGLTRISDVIPAIKQAGVRVITIALG